MAGDTPSIGEQERQQALATLEGLHGLGEAYMRSIGEKLKPYVVERATQALREAGGDRAAAAELLHKWAKKDDKLWRQLREPFESPRDRPPALKVAVDLAAQAGGGDA